MSVTFYDPKNPYVYDDEYNVVDGGPEANFANVNARLIIEVLGLENDDGLCGQVKAKDLLGLIERATIGVKSFCQDDAEREYLLRGFENLRRVANFGAILDS